MTARWIRRHAAPIAGATVAAVAVAGIAAAAIPGADGTIAGCYPKSGQLRVIDAAAGVTCAAGETPLNWSQRGPTGATGATGPRGADGAPGANDQHWASVQANGAVRSSDSYAFVWNNRVGVKSIYLQDIADASSCVAVAQQSPRAGGGTPAPASATTAFWPGWVTVYTYNATGQPVDADLSVIVACGSSRTA